MVMYTAKACLPQNLLGVAMRLLSFAQRNKQRRERDFYQVSFCKSVMD
jgi:hypothetical protein